jgi:hypothetical protein
LPSSQSSEIQQQFSWHSFVHVWSLHTSGVNGSPSKQSAAPSQQDGSSPSIVDEQLPATQASRVHGLPSSQSELTQQLAQTN